MAGASILVINAAGAETRVALVENGTIHEFYHERKREKGIVGNIYKGRVVRVLPGMQAAFVDIGLEKAAFLPGADFFPLSADEYALSETHGEAPEAPASGAPASEGDDSGAGRRRVLPPIEERLQKCQVVIV